MIRWKRSLSIPSFPLPRRSDVRERLDNPAQHMSELRGNLRDIRHLNAWFGGTRLAVRSVEQELAGQKCARLLDVATGSADIPLALSRWSAAYGVPLEIVGADLSPEVLAEARRHIIQSGIRLARADARSLPWQDGSFDVVMCCLALHHFSPTEAVQVLREMWRVSARTVIVIDLRRSYTAYIGTWLATHTVARNRLTRHDGPLSVLRSYTPSEMALQARAAGLDRVSITLHPFYRQVMVCTKVEGSSRA